MNMSFIRAGGWGCLLAMAPAISAWAQTQAVTPTQAPRPPLITETLAAHDNLRTIFRNSSPGYDDWKLYGQSWQKILTAMEVPAHTPGAAYSNCHYDSAITALENIRTELGPENAYQKQWAVNQDRVFSACDDRRSDSLPPEELKEDGLPARAMSDFLYQKASWSFYRRQYAEALELYRKVAALPKAPMRPYAAYMEVRTLAKLNRDKEAYDRIDAILSDPSLSGAHAIAANYRFILMYYGVQDDVVAEKYLRWLVQLIRLSPEKSIHLRQSYADYFDATEHLNHYFPLFDNQSGRVDWWLQKDLTPDSPRMKAVKHLAPEEELVDWMQAKWAYNIFATDWLWALHSPDASYWKQNDAIVEHVWQRWQHGDGLEWLKIAAGRIHPKAPLADEVLQATALYLARDWQEESPEYQEWLHSIWSNAVRIYMGKEKFPEALALLKKPVGKPEAYRRAYYYHPRIDENATYENAMRWLVYTGQVQQARELLPVLQARYKDHGTPYKLAYWEILLATDWQQAMTAAMRHDRWSSTQTPPALWQAMVDRFSTRALFDLAENKDVDETQRAQLALTTLTRAMVLDEKNDVIDRYAVLAAKLNPAIRERILNAVAAHTKEDYIRLMLRVPRMRLVPFPSFNDYHTFTEDPQAIDVYNHNDNNWWCRVEDEYLDAQVLDAAKILPIRDRYFPFPAEEREFAPYLEKQKTLLATHPYHALSDVSETTVLENIPSAPEYLTRAVIAQGGKSWFQLFFNEKDDRQQAADLHHAVRVTRYGCQRNGSHAAYSREAFERLHGQYPGSVWAKATPYWFDCSHFRNGCPASEAGPH